MFNNSQHFTLPGPKDWQTRFAPHFLPNTSVGKNMLGKTAHNFGWQNKMAKHICKTTYWQHTAWATPKFYLIKAFMGCGLPLKYIPILDLFSLNKKNFNLKYRVSENEGQIENGYKTLKIRVSDPE